MAGLGFGRGFGKYSAGESKPVRGPMAARPASIKALLLLTSAVLVAGPLLTSMPAKAYFFCARDTTTVPGTTIDTCASGVTLGTLASGYAADASETGAAGTAPRHSQLFQNGSLTTDGPVNGGIKVLRQGGNGLDAASFAVPGSGGGDGSTVTIDNSGTITTRGDTANAILAASIGGDGGRGHDDGPSNGSSNGGDGGNGLAVSVNNTATGTIITFGANAHGIFAQSLGGAGGAGGNNNHFGGGSILGSYGGHGGTADVVTIINAGTISTSGDNAHGIYAESKGGAGGAAGTGGAIGGGNGTTGNGGNITVANEATGSITTGGAGAHGVFAESTGGDIDVINLGTISSLNGNAIDATGNNVVVFNNGTTTGNVRLRGTSSAIFRNTVGVFESGGTVDLGANGVLDNRSTLSPGGTGTVQTTNLTGNFVQTAGGVFQVDANWTTDTADVLAITGTATLDGSIVVNPINFPTTAGLEKQFTILTATGGVTDNGIVAVDTAAVDYSVVHPDANTTDIHARINFLGVGEDGDDGDDGVGVDGLAPNQTAVGTTLNNIVSSGGTLGFVPTLLTLPSQAQLAEALGQLAPSGDGAANSSALSTGNTFAGQLLSCRVTGEADAGAIIREGQCLWARATVRKLTNDGGTNGIGYQETAAFFSAGAQFDLGGPWRLGTGIGYENTDLATNNVSKSEGDRLHLGGVLKYNPGPLFLAASITGGHGWNNNERRVAFGAFNTVATSETDTSFVSGRFTAAYLLNFGAWYIKPQVNVAATYLSRDGYTETANGGVALNVRESDDTVVSVNPALEFGAQYPIAGGGIARPFIRAGVKWIDTDSFTTTASFAAAPAGIAPFTITSKIDDVVADIGAGVDFITPGDTVLRLQYDGQYGEMTTLHSGSAKLSVAF